jgi:MFS family permease
MTCSTALIGAYFDGARRGRYLALQTGTAPIAAVTVIAIGGALGASSWRAPFLAYGFGFVLTPLTALLLKEVRAPREPTEATAVSPAPESAPFVWGKLIWICAVTLFAMTAFLVTVVQTGFLLTERGVSAPQAKLTLAFALLSTGFFLIALLPGWRSVVIGAAIANLGAGMMLPTLITWAISTLPARLRGSGTGLWMAASFLGQFLSPLAVLGLRDLTGSLSQAILVYAIACGGSGIAALVARLRSQRAVACAS